MDGDEEEHDFTVKPPPMDAISAQLYRHRKRGQKFYDLAESSLVQKLKSAEFLRLDVAAFFFYLSSVSFRCCSRWTDAAASLVRCAEIHLKAKMSQEAAVLYSEASEVVNKTDREEGKRSAKKAIAIYCDMGRFDIAGRMERKLAKAEFHMGHWEEAAQHYRKSANFLAGEMMLDQSDACIEKSAECYINMHELADAARMYIILAEGCKESNLRRFNARSKIFMALLCHIGIPMTLNEIVLPPVVDWRGDPRERDKDEIEEDTKKLTLEEWNRSTDEKYDNVLKLMSEYEAIDFMWASAKDQVFLKNIITARRAYDKHELADHLYHWNMVRPLDRVQLRLLRVLVDEVQHELDRRTSEYRLEALRLEKRKIKIEKLKKKKEIMRDMGIKGNAVVDDEEVEKEALRKQALDDAIKEHEERDVAIHGLEQDDDPDLMEEKADEDSEAEDSDEEGGMPAKKEETPKKERRRRGKKAQDRK